MIRKAYLLSLSSLELYQAMTFYFMKSFQFNIQFIKILQIILTRYCIECSTIFLISQKCDCFCLCSLKQNHEINQRRILFNTSSKKLILKVLCHPIRETHWTRVPNCWLSHHFQIIVFWGRANAIMLNEIVFEKIWKRYFLNSL